MSVVCDWLGVVLKPVRFSSFGLCKCSLIAELLEAIHRGIVDDPKLSHIRKVEGSHTLYKMDELLLLLSVDFEIGPHVI